MNNNNPNLSFTNRNNKNKLKPIEEIPTEPTPTEPMPKKTE